MTALLWKIWSVRRRDKKPRKESAHLHHPAHRLVHHLARARLPRQALLRVPHRPLLPRIPRRRRVRVPPPPPPHHLLARPPAQPPPPLLAHRPVDPQVALLRVIGKRKVGRERSRIHQQFHFSSNFLRFGSVHSSCQCRVSVVDSIE